MVLDVILNHTGDSPTTRTVIWWEPGNQWMDPGWDGRPYEVSGYRDKDGRPTLLAVIDLDAQAHPMLGRTVRSGPPNFRTRKPSPDAAGSATGTMTRSSWSGTSRSSKTSTRGRAMSMATARARR